MMMIVPNSHARKGEKKRGDVKEDYGGIRGDEQENADYGRTSQQHVAPTGK